MSFDSSTVRLISFKGEHHFEPWVSHPKESHGTSMADLVHPTIAAGDEKDHMINPDIISNHHLP